MALTVFSPMCCCTDGILPYVLLHLEYLFLTVGTRGRHGLVNARQPAVFPEFREVYVHHRAYDL